MRDLYFYGIDFNEIKKHLKGIYLKGSHLKPESVDEWSDVDMIIESDDIDVVKEHMIHQLMPIVASERYDSVNTCLYRLVSYKNHEFNRYDIQILNHLDEISEPVKTLYGQEKGFNERTLDFTFNITGSKIDSIWFLFYECVKKYKRYDYLIGHHLFHSILNEILVIHMQLRDQHHKTNIHRYGYKDSVLEQFDLNQIHTKGRYQLLVEVATYFSSLVHTDERLKVFKNYCKE